MLSLTLSFLISGILMAVGVLLTVMRANQSTEQPREADGHVTPPT